MKEEDLKPYIPEIDDGRLKNAITIVRELMSDQKWRTYQEIALETGQRPEYVSSNLRDLRKAPHGSYVVERRPRGDRSAGLFEYRLQPPGTISEWSGARPKKKKLGRGFKEGVRWASTIFLSHSTVSEGA